MGDRLGPESALPSPCIGEARERSYGLIKEAVVVCVVHTERGAARRIISARKAARKEREEFHACLTRAIG
ncbi:MAG: BrnT family toxin [Alphaproteobacteria bacterium]|nr:BrnT family toxin [Alphaproteobacteria bacterium]